MKNFEHLNAASFEQATQELKSSKRGQPIAGGTDLLGTLKKNILPESPDLMVNLKTIPNASYVLDQGDRVAVGALTTLSEVESDSAFAGELKAVAQAAHSVATPIIRNTATLGGNLCQDVRCWYYRYPDSVGGRLLCARKGGDQCYAIQGRNQYHSIMGGMKTHHNACSAECPAGTDIPAYMEKIRENDWDAAAEIIMRVNPMPMLTSRVCPHTCQSVCNQCEHGDPVSIHSVERAVGDYILANAGKFYKAPETSTGKKVSIVGGGPAGLTAAYYLRKMGHEVTIYEKMEEAGGVMMYGIPEYRLPKHYVRDLITALTGMGIVIQNNTEVGKDITLEEIKAASDTVFLDTGAWKQPILGIDGESLTQFGLNFLVEVKKFMTKQIGKEVLVCGGGNVAMDVARELMRNADDLKARTDIPDNVYEGIKANKARVLHLFIRRGVAQAKFSVQELREMEKLPGVQLIINEDDFELDDDTIEEAGKDKLTRQMVEELFAIREMAEDMEDDGDVDFEGNPADRKYYIHFNSAPTEVLGEDGKVVAIRVERTETGADGRMHRTGEFEDYPVQAVYHAIGYQPASAPGIAYDQRRAHLANANGDGRITTEAEGGEVRERLYATGWAKRGPVGLIGSTKSDALMIVTNMLEDLSKAAEGGCVAPDRDPESIDRLLAERGVKPIDFAGWKKIDAFERAEGAKEGREHKKVIDPDQMRELAHA